MQAHQNPDTHTERLTLAQRFRKLSHDLEGWADRIELTREERARVGDLTTEAGLLTIDAARRGFLDAVPHLAGLLCWYDGGPDPHATFPPELARKPLDFFYVVADRLLPAMKATGFSLHLYYRPIQRTGRSSQAIFWAGRYAGACAALAAIVAQQTTEHAVDVQFAAVTQGTPATKSHGTPIRVGNLAELVGTDPATVRRYAKRMGVNRPGQGQQNFCYSISDARTILNEMARHGAKKTRTQAAEALRQLDKPKRNRQTDI